MQKVKKEHIVKTQKVLLKNNFAYNIYTLKDGQYAIDPGIVILPWLQNLIKKKWTKNRYKIFTASKERCNFSRLKIITAEEAEKLIKENSVLI